MMMAESLLNNLKTDRVHRIDVNFEIPQKFSYISIEFSLFFWQDIRKYDRKSRTYPVFGVAAFDENVGELFR